MELDMVWRAFRALSSGAVRSLLLLCLVGLWLVIPQHWWLAFTLVQAHQCAC